MVLYKQIFTTFRDPSEFLFGFSKKSPVQFFKTTSWKISLERFSMFKTFLIGPTIWEINIRLNARATVPRKNVLFLLRYSKLDAINNLNSDFKMFCFFSMKMWFNSGSESYMEKIQNHTSSRVESHCDIRQSASGTSYTIYALVRCTTEKRFVFYLLSRTDGCTVPTLL